MWQAEHVKAQLEKLYRGLSVDLVPMTTRGDRILDRSLARVGGKGLFVKELEVAIEEGRADLAVHSCKDVPMKLAQGFTLGAILEREDPRDAFVSNAFACEEHLPARAVVGTSSLRREAQLRERLPHIEVRALRGNIDTRFAKLDRGEVDAMVLALAGLKRLGLAHRARTILEPSTSLPAVGQGALAIEVRTERPDVLALIRALDHRPTALCVAAERAVSRALGGSCQVPLAAYATLQADEIELSALVASPDGRDVARARARGSMADPESLGENVARTLRANGAERILASLPQPAM